MPQVSGHALVVRHLTRDDEAAFLRAVRAWPPDHPTEFAPQFDGDVAAYVEKLRAFERGERLPEGWVPSTTLFGFAGEEIAGRVQLRHTLNERLHTIGGGHVGYAVLPAFRNRGYATALLRHALSRAAALGLTRVLVTCNEDNLASARVAEHCGGVYSGTFPADAGQPPKRHYWIEIE